MRADRGGRGERSPFASGRLTIPFEVLRGRSAGWMAFGLTVGFLLIALMGTVAQWLGGILVGVGVISAWLLLRTFLYPTAAIIVDDESVALPRAKCTRAVDRSPMNAVTAAYFLRRSVPWTRAAPVLVIEAGGQAYTYPRDWFVNEADQRQIIHAILGRIRPEAIAGVSTHPADRTAEPALAQKAERRL